MGCFLSELEQELVYYLLHASLLCNVQHLVPHPLERWHYLSLYGSLLQQQPSFSYRVDYHQQEQTMPSSYYQVICVYLYQTPFLFH